MIKNYKEFDYKAYEFKKEERSKLLKHLIDYNQISRLDDDTYIDLYYKDIEDSRYYIMIENMSCYCIYYYVSEIEFCSDEYSEGDLINNLNNRILHACSKFGDPQYSHSEICMKHLIELLKFISDCDEHYHKIFNSQ